MVTRGEGGEWRMGMKCQKWTHQTVLSHNGLLLVSDFDTPTGRVLFSRLVHYPHFKVEEAETRASKRASRAGSD